MNSAHEIRSDRKKFGLLIDQYGQIAGLIIGALICSLFVESKVILFIVLIVFPVIYILLVSKFNKPVVLIKIDYINKTICFKVATRYKFHRTINIAFKDLVIIYKPKILLRSYYNVLEIKEQKKLMVVIPRNSKANSKIIDQFLNEAKILKNLNLINNEQIIIKI